MCKRSKRVHLIGFTCRNSNFFLKRPRMLEIYVNKLYNLFRQSFWQRIGRMERACVWDLLCLNTLTTSPLRQAIKFVQKMMMMMVLHFRGTPAVFYVYAWFYTTISISTIIKHNLETSHPNKWTLETFDANTLNWCSIIATNHYLSDDGYLICLRNSTYNTI